MNNLAKKVAMSADQWIEVGTISDIPKDGARVVKTPLGDIAVFRNMQDEIFALRRFHHARAIFGDVGDGAYFNPLIGAHCCFLG